MEIGDMVIRAYSWHSIIPGIIVDKEITYMEDKTWAETDGPFRYEDHQFIVQWSDGTQSSEMDMELDYLEDALESIKKFRENEKEFKKYSR